MMFKPNPFFDLMMGDDEPTIVEQLRKEGCVLALVAGKGPNGDDYWYNLMKKNIHSLMRESMTIIGDEPYYRFESDGTLVVGGINNTNQLEITLPIEKGLAFLKGTVTQTLGDDRYFVIQVLGDAGEIAKVYTSAPYDGEYEFDERVLLGDNDDIIRIRIYVGSALPAHYFEFKFSDLKIETYPGSVEMHNLAGSAESGLNTIKNVDVDLIKNPEFDYPEGTTSFSTYTIYDWSNVYFDYTRPTVINGKSAIIQDVPDGQRAVFDQRDVQSKDGHKVFGYCEVMRLSDDVHPGGYLCDIARGTGGYAKGMMMADDYNALEKNVWVPCYASNTVDLARWEVETVRLSLGTYTIAPRKTAYRNPKIIDVGAVDEFFGTTYSSLDDDGIYAVMDEIIALEKEAKAYVLDGSDDFGLLPSLGDLDITNKHIYIGATLSHDSDIDPTTFILAKGFGAVGSCQFGMVVRPSLSTAAMYLRGTARGTCPYIPDGRFKTIGMHWDSMDVNYYTDNTLLTKVASALSEPAGGGELYIGSLNGLSYFNKGPIGVILVCTNTVGLNIDKILKLEQKLAAPFKALNPPT